VSRARWCTRVLEHRARKRFGQNFLHDRYVLGRIIEAINPRAEDSLVEIGPGRGALTWLLAEHVQPLHVVEIDRDLIAMLREAPAAERLVIHEGDALEFDFASLAAPLRVVGNLPYNISTPLLFYLSRFVDRLRDGHFMLQREVVERMVAEPDTEAYGRLSVMLQCRFEMHKLFIVPSGAFTPQPKVESAIVRLVPLASPAVAPALMPHFEAIVTRAFTMRRKTLRNALAAVLDAPAIEAAGVDPSVRAEVLDVAAFARLAAASMPPP
jgi:16S rRNA (adenine1518-N6/adenine1519-N6)-dimethyltransferase